MTIYLVKTNETIITSFISLRNAEEFIKDVSIYAIVPVVVQDAQGYPDKP